jgi:hypothetical protein
MRNTKSAPPDAFRSLLQSRRDVSLTGLNLFHRRGKLWRPTCQLWSSVWPPTGSLVDSGRALQGAAGISVAALCCRCHEQEPCRIGLRRPKRWANLPYSKARATIEARAKRHSSIFGRFISRAGRTELGLEHFTGRAAKIAIRIATIRVGGREPGNYDVRVTAEDFEWAAELVRIAGDIVVKEAPSEMEVDLTRGETAKKIKATLRKHSGETNGVRQYVGRCQCQQRRETWTMS